jgi:hypothetical protein
MGEHQGADVFSPHHTVRSVSWGRNPFSSQVLPRPQFENPKKPLSRHWHAIRPAFLITLVVMSLLLTLKSVGDYRSSRERGRFVVSMIREYRAGMLTHFKAQSFKVDHESLETDPAALQAWLVQRFLEDSRPIQISQKLDRLSHYSLATPHSSSVLRKTFKRWNESLIRWERTLGSGESMISGGSYEKVPPQLLFKQARLHYFEASGYQKIGKKYDASILYLWSFELMSRFIQADPLSSEVPQALYLLGASQVRLREAFSSGLRSDRLLNLCVELYPDSVWATLARELLQEEFGYAV